MIKRILKLAEDNKRVVIVDPETERAFVILPLSTYERLMDECAFDEEEFDEVDDDWAPSADGAWPESEVLPDTDGIPSDAGSYRAALQDDTVGRLTEQNLIDNIDRDIAAWKAAQEQAAEEPAPAAAGMDELTLTPVPGEEAPMKPPASAEEEKFYIEPVA